MRIETDEEDYQLVGPGEEESGVTEYGDVAEVEIGGVLHFTTVDSADDAEAAQIYRMVDGHPELIEEAHTVEEVEFELEAEDEADEDEADIPA